MVQLELPELPDRRPAAPPKSQVLSTDDLKNHINGQGTNANPCVMAPHECQRGVSAGDTPTAFSWPFQVDRQRPPAVPACTAS